MGIPEGEEKKNRIFETKMIENFPQINVRHQTTDPGSSEHISRIYTKDSLQIGISFSTYRKSKTKKKS